jgi:hypothetical protein
MCCRSIFGFIATAEPLWYMSSDMCLRSRASSVLARAKKVLSSLVDFISGGLFAVLELSRLATRMPKGEHKEAVSRTYGPLPGQTPGFAREN